VVDRCFGRLVERVDLLGVGDNTLLFFMSDHGHYLGYPNDGGQLGKALGYRKRDGHMAGGDADVFTPLLDSVSNPIFMARMPGQKKGKVRQEMIQPADVMPTVLESMKVRVPKTVQGSSFLPLLQGKKKKWRTTAVSSGHRQFAQISDQRWLYGLWAYRHAPKLFDRKTDPDQKRNVLRKHPTVARRMHRALMNELNRLEAPASFLEILDKKAP
jgi:arylsulfatase A-like enzyme